MIISRTPFRVSLFGGGTDYPTWYLQNGGAVLGFAINKYCYISLRHLPPFFDHKHRIVYSQTENVGNAGEINHPAVRAVLQEHGEFDGLELHHDADLPARSGLGSSSSFTAGLLNCIYAMNQRMVSSRQLAQETIRIEQDVIGEAVGSQDQIWAAYGGFNLVEFDTSGDFSVSPVIISQHRRRHLSDSLLLVFSGFARTAAKIAIKKIEKLHDREAQLKKMRVYVDQALDILRDEAVSVTELGGLMHENWLQKRQITEEIATAEIDDIYQRARDAGAIGGKVLGAGGGGFMIFMAPPEKMADVRAALSDLVQVDFAFGAPGSRIVLYEPEGLAAV